MSCCDETTARVPRFDLSRRSVLKGAVLVASGTSCRHQVADFTNVRALHAAELLQSLLPPRNAR